MTITINNKEVTLKKTFRSYIIFESATGKAFAPHTITDSILYMYCVIISSDESLELTFEDFLEWLDNNETALQEFTDWLIKQSEIEGGITKKKRTLKTTKK